MREIAHYYFVLCSFLAMAASLAAQTPDHTGQVTPPCPLGELIRQSDPIVVLEVERIDREKQLVIFKSAKALKGQADPGPIRHHLYGTNLTVLDWAKPGKKAVCFYHGGKAETCLGNHWYYHWNFGEHTNPPVWTCADWVDGFPRSYVGPVDKLCDHVTAILNGRDVVVTAQAPEDRVSCLRPRNPVGRDWLRGQKGRVWRIKAGPKVVSPIWSDESPEFVGWGVGGTEIVPALCAALRDNDALVRAEAVEDLGRLGNVGKGARPALRNALKDADGFVRVYAVAALARIEPGSMPDMSVLSAAMKDNDAALRRAAVGVIASFCAPAVSAVPDLIALLQDKSDSVREAAAFALGEMESGLPFSMHSSGEVVAALGRTLRENPEEKVRLQAASALLKFGARSWAAVPALRAALLGEKRSRATAAVAADVLARLDPPAVEILAEAIQGKHCAAPAEVARYLGSLGPRARLALPALQRTPENPDDPWARCQKARALLAIDRRVSLATALSVLMDNGEDAYLAEALVTLGQLGADAKPAVPVLAAALRTDNCPQCWLAARALGNIGPEAKEAIPALRMSLNNDWVRFAAAEALWRAGDPAAATPVLVQGISDKSPQVRAAAAAALARVGPAARGVLPTLRQALQKANDPVRAQLALAVRRIEHSGGRIGHEDSSWEKAVEALLEIQPDNDYGSDTPRLAFTSSAWRGAHGVDDDLVAIWREEDAELGKQVKSLLRELACERDPAPVLDEACKANSMYTRMAAALALARIQPQHRSVASVFMQTLERRCGLFYYVSKALADLGPNARIAVPWLVEALKDGDHDVYLAALRALQAIDSKAAGRVWSVGKSALISKGNTAATVPSSRKLDELWNDLASQDTCTAYQEIWMMIAKGKPAVPFLQKRLQAVPHLPSQKVASMVNDLDSSRFDVRKNATQELAQIIEQAEPILRQALASRPSLELRQRAEQLLEKLDPLTSPDRLRALRALVVLEHIGTPEAREVITTLAKGAPEARLTQEAKASLQRLAKRSDGMP
jgi:HEAT repeat protein